MSSDDALKVVLIGESGTGKTSIIQRFAYKLFDDNCASSISSQYITKTIELSDINKTIRFDIWDTAGQERYRSMLKLFYKDAHVILFVYDITSLKSFEELKKFWINQAMENCPKNTLFGIVANKSDLYINSQVPRKDVLELANKIGAIFQIASAKSGAGINKLFENIGRKYLDPDYDYQIEDKKAEEEYKNKKIERRNSKISSLKNNENHNKLKLDTESIKPKPKEGCC